MKRRNHCSLPLLLAVALRSAVAFPAEGQEANAAPGTNVLTLDAAIRLALEDNSEIRVLSADIASARGEFTSAKTWQNPEVSIAPGFKSVRNPSDTQFHGDFGLEQTFEWPGKRALRRAVAEKNVAVRHLALTGFRSQLALQVRRAYFTLQGFEGKMFSPLAFTISFALLGSLILSLTLVPMLCTVFLKQVSQEHDPWHIRCLKDIYLVLLKPCVRRPWSVVIPAVLALVGALALVPRIGTEFLPTLDEGAVSIKMARLPSISLPQSLELAGRVERIVKQFPEVIDVVSRTGRADIASDPEGVDAAWPA